MHVKGAETRVAIIDQPAFVAHEKAFIIMHSMTEAKLQDLLQ